MSELFPEASAWSPPPAELYAELARALNGPASRLVAEMRLEQILKHGHDAERDSMEPIDRLPRLAQERMIRALDHIRGTGASRNLIVARKDLGRVAAMCMAAIDRIDLALKLQEDV